MLYLPMINTNKSKKKNALNLPLATKIVIFDLEWTSWAGFAESNWSMPGKHREILQIGAVKLDCKDMLLEVDSFERLVKPSINMALSSYIKKLTGLSQAKIDTEGIYIRDAIMQFLNFCSGIEYICFNGEDDLVIRENCNLNNIICPKIFLKGVDLQPLLASALGESEKWIASGEVMERLNFPKIGKPHNAIDDARNLAQALRLLIFENSLNPN